MEKRPLLLCTDPGIDDFIALSMVLARPEFDVLGMIALSGNVGLDVTVNNALLACELNGRSDIPVLAGSAKPLARPARSASNIHGKSGLGKSTELYAKGRPLASSGADFILQMAEKYAGRLEILSLGPLTDVALALQKSPEAAKKIARVVVMGGGIHAGNATKYAEFNIVADPEAAQVVFSSGVKTVMIGLDATNCCLQPRSDIELLRAPGTLGRVIPAMLSDYADVYKSVHNLDGMIIHDAISAVYLWKPELFSCLPCRIEVCLDEGEHLGQTVPEAGDTCLAATSCDAQAVREEILSMMQQVIAAH